MLLTAPTRCAGMLAHRELHLTIELVLVVVVGSRDDDDDDDDKRGQARECEHRMAVMEKLRAVLRENSLLSEPVEAELQQGERFWALERVICSNLKMRVSSSISVKAG